MLKNYLKIALRNLKKHKAYTVINVFGLAFGMACCIAIALFVRDEVQYDTFFDAAERIYRVTLDVGLQGDEMQTAYTVYVRNQQTIGVGAGQMSRVYSARIAAIKAQDENLKVAGSVMASDAFFPFRDAIDAADENGITAIIQPGGSINDEDVIEAVDELGMAMVLTNMRHFRH